MNGVWHGHVVKGNIVREDDHEIHHRRSRSRAHAGEGFVTILRDPLVLIGRQAIGGKVVRAACGVVIQRLHGRIFFVVWIC
jgi:hypothetical protein